MATEDKYLVSLEDLKVVGDEVIKKANVDGSYENLTAGNAEQLVSTVFVEDSTPYKFRTAGGSADIGDREYDEIVGGTVAWNQLITDPTFSDESKWASITGPNTATISTSGNVMTMTVVQKNGSNGIGNKNSSIPTLGGHKLLFSVEVNPSTSTTIRFGSSAAAAGNYGLNYSINVEASKWNKVERIGLCAAGNTANNCNLYLDTSASISVNETVQVRNFVCFDLTQLFGSTIADYIYSLEQANAGAGVAWFRKLFPNDYYAYNAGELMSVNTSAHNTVGFNAWDEEWEVGAYNSASGEKTNSINDRIRSKNLIPVIPGATYYVKTPNSLQIYNYDANKKYIGWLSGTQNQTRTFGDNVYYIAFNGASNSGTTYNHDICINLSWDGERDGEYEPYVKNSYPLDDSLTLRGIPKLDSNNELYYDGDVYQNDGTVMRKYKEVDLGSLNWEATSSYVGVYRASVSLPDAVNGQRSINKKAPIILSTNALTNSLNVTDASTATAGLIGVAYNALFVTFEESKTASEVKTALNGIKMLYQLKAESITTETADPYQSPQIVDDFGTEEYVSDTIVPVGHNTKYTNNLRAKLEMAPESPSGDGDYIVRQTNGQNSYVPLLFPASDIPAAPEPDGNYVLKCTVSDGTATYTWEAQA